MYDAAVQLPIMRIFDVLSLKQFLLPCDISPTLKLHKVLSDCQLREYVTINNLCPKYGFRRGHTYYEFTNEVENILEGKEVLLQEKENNKIWFRLAPPEEVAAGSLKLYGEGITRSSFGDRYRVFIQSFGSGARHLPKGSSILCDHSDIQVVYYSSCRSKLILNYHRYSLISFHWCLFAQSILLTKLLTQRKGVQLNNSVYKIV